MADVISEGLRDYKQSPSCRITKCEERVEVLSFDGERDKFSNSHNHRQPNFIYRNLRTTSGSVCERIIGLFNKV